jgi:cytidyltransferase-like protein
MKNISPSGEMPIWVEEKLVLVTGGFDPLHSGHIEYFEEAKQLGDRLIVGVNSDDWLTRKKGKPFMTFAERTRLVGALECVDTVVWFDDKDDTACGAISDILDRWPRVVFANGGDRTDGTNTPEYKMYGDDPRVEFVWGVGGSKKKNSSSWILDEWKTQKTERPWGNWRVLDDKGTVKVKELIIEPGQSLSDQRHEHRSEHWYVLKGTVVIEEEGDNWSVNTLHENMTHLIPKGTWHKATNKGNTPTHILEVQYGTECVEEDIERR